MTSRSLLVAAVLGFSLVAPLQALAEPPRTAESRITDSVHVSGVIEVDALGRVERVSLRQSPLRQQVEDSVLEAMQGWTFEPFVLEGAARRIRTSVYVRIDELKSEAGHQLVFGEVEFGQPLIAQQVPPRYPGSALRDRISAEVLLRLTLDDEGGVALAEPVTAKVLNLHVRNQDRHRRLLAPFVRASVASTEQWRFEFAEPRPDGERHQLLVPIVFTIDGQRLLDAQGDSTLTQPVMFELSSPLGRPIEALARELEGRTGGLSIDPAPSPLKLRTKADEALTM